MLLYFWKASCAASGWWNHTKAVPVEPPLRANHTSYFMNTWPAAVIKQLHCINWQVTIMQVHICSSASCCRRIKQKQNQELDHCVCGQGAACIALQTGLECRQKHVGTGARITYAGSKRTPHFFNSPHSWNSSCNHKLVTVVNSAVTPVDKWGKATKQNIPWCQCQSHCGPG